MWIWHIFPTNFMKIAEFRKSPACVHPIQPWQSIFSPDSRYFQIALATFSPSTFRIWFCQYGTQIAGNRAIRIQWFSILPRIINLLPHIPPPGQRLKVPMFSACVFIEQYVLKLMRGILYLALSVSQFLNWFALSLPNPWLVVEKIEMASSVETYQCFLSAVVNEPFGSRIYCVPPRKKRLL